MRKSVIAVAIGAVAIFSLGYLGGMIHGPATSSAAGKQVVSSSIASSGTRSLVVVGKVTSVKGSTIVMQRGPILAGVFCNVVHHLPMGASSAWGNRIAARCATSKVNTAATITVNLTGATRYVAARRQASSASAIKVGNLIRVNGTMNAATNTLTASSVNTMPAAQRISRFLHAFGGWGHSGGTPPRVGGFGRPGIGLAAKAATGSVSSVSGDSISLTPSTATAFPGFRDQYASVKTIVVTTKTVFYGGPFAADANPTVKVGEFVNATGSLSSDGKTLSATTINVGGSMPMSFRSPIQPVQLGGQN